MAVRAAAVDGDRSGPSKFTLTMSGPHVILFGGRSYMNSLQQPAARIWFDRQIQLPALAFTVKRASGDRSELCLAPFV